MDFDPVGSLHKPAGTRIVFLVMDGLGGLPRDPGGATELEAAHTPNLDRLAAEGICGLHQPIAPGITPGSGPSHLALFGYGPFEYQVGRGILTALGIDFDLRPGDVAARGNFCTLDDAGRVADRRAGRIPTEKNEALCALLRQIRLPGVTVFVETVKAHRFLLVLRGDGLSAELADTDPQEVGKKPLPVKPASGKAQRTADLLATFVDQARQALAGRQPANMILLRGFAQLPDWPSFSQRFGLHAAAIAGYPMYRGVARLIGMEAFESQATLAGVLGVLESHWEDYDFFFLHDKDADRAGEDGDFDAKVQAIEQVDAQIPRLLALEPDVIVVTGDHSTPAVLKYHSWHPVPVLLWSRYCRTDSVTRFGERSCLAGGLGPRIPATDLMPLALANALRLDKFGA
ncbi:MAG: 2,3-bisphosphoglycerate-independent phosphoglycerate mutase [Chloroflexota bacterium]